MTRVCQAVACAALAIAAQTTVVASGDDGEALERRVMALSRQLRCLVCQNETLADSQAGLAIDLRREIREQMAAGRSDAEITAFLTDRYGEFIRYRPAMSLKTSPLWCGPFALLAGVLVALYRRRTRRHATLESRPTSENKKMRVRRLLNKDGSAARSRARTRAAAADLPDRSHFAGATTSGAQSRALPIMLVIGIPLLAILLYLIIGAPDVILPRP